MKILLFLLLLSICGCASMFYKNINETNIGSYYKSIDLSDGMSKREAVIIAQYEMIKTAKIQNTKEIEKVNLNKVMSVIYKSKNDMYNRYNENCYIVHFRYKTNWFADYFHPFNWYVTVNAESGYMIDAGEHYQK